MKTVQYENIKNIYSLAGKLSGKEVSDELFASIINANEAVGQMLALKNEEIDKPEWERKEEQRKLERARTHVRIDLTEPQRDLVSSLIGQMSDGMWENNPSYEKYWKNMELDGNILFINLNAIKYAAWSVEHEKEVHKVWDAGEYAIRNWLARKAQLVQNADLKDNQGFDSSKMDARTFVAKVCGDKQAFYMDRGVNQTYEQVQAAIDSLREAE